MGEFVKLPLGRKTVIPPLSVTSGLFPFKVSGSGLVGFFDVLQMRSVFTKFSYCVKSHQVRFTLWNSSQVAVSLAAKTFVLGVKCGTESVVVRRLDGRCFSLTDGQSVTLTQQTLALCTRSSVTWDSEFPEVFSEEVVGIPSCMQQLAVQRQEFKLKGNIFGASGFSYNIEKLINNPKLIQDTLREMKDNGYIEPVPDEDVCHLHPLLFLPKGQDRVRLVCDMTELNSYFTHVKGDLPGVDQILRLIPATWTVFCKVDIRNGFFRVPLAVDIRNFFSFRLGAQRWRFCSLPQGWVLSPGLFHERICRITKGLGLISYVDDLLLGAESLDLLKGKVRILLSRLRQFGLQVQKRKFVYGVKTVNFLGFDVSAGGIIDCSTYLTERKDVILSAITTKRGLQKILGIFNFIRAHIPNLAGQLFRLYDMLTLCKGQLTNEQGHLINKEVQRVWTVILSSCVKVMKGQPTGHDFQYELYTDWSQRAKGYFLLRRYGDGRRELVDLGSIADKQLRAVSSFLGELSSMKWGLTKVRHLIQGHVVIVHCDNTGTVNKMNNFKEEGEDIRVSRLYAWIRINVPQAQFVFYPGQNNVLADYLSRKEIRTKINYIQVQDRVVDVGLPSRRLPMPSGAERRQLIQGAHSGHWSSQRTYENLLLDLQGKWPKMREEVDQFVARCRQCQFHGEAVIRDDLRGPQARKRNQLIHLDFCGPFRNGEHLLVGVDNVTRFAHAVTIRSPTSSAVINFLKSWILINGRIEAIFTDQGTQFMSSSMQSWLHRNNVQHVISPVYYHNANGICERLHRTIQGRLRRFLEEGMSWESAVIQSVLQINRSYHRTLGTCPVTLMHSLDRQGNVVEGVELLMNKVLERNNEARFSTSRWWTRRRKFSAALQIGDSVVVEIPNWERQAKGKLDRRWEGPYEVKAKMSRSTWAVSKEAGIPRDWLIVHSSQVKKCFLPEHSG